MQQVIPQELYGKMSADPAIYLGSSVLILAIIAVLGHYFVKLVLRRVTSLAANRLNTVSIEIVNDDSLFGRLALFFPAIIIYQGANFLPVISENHIVFIRKGIVIATIAIGLGVLTRLLYRCNEVYSRFPISRSRPIKGIIQVATLVLYIISFVLIVATALDKSPLVFVSGLGAMTAVIMLVFRDTILSLVAGIQLTTNNLIRVGDWIEMPQFGADGDVVDIALHVVRVQNWDKTITVIPAHKFLENSFKNWRGMTDAGGRRIKRSLFIDMNTIRFLTPDEVDRIGTFAVLKDYVKQKREEIVEQKSNSEEVLRSNIRQLTNVGTLRAYIFHYLKSHPGIHKDMTFLVRQLQPTPEGLPIEIYVFTNDIRWAYYENIQSDIFDHILAVIPEFGLRVYQQPSGSDFQGLASPTFPLDYKALLNSAKS